MIILFCGEAWAPWPVRPRPFGTEFVCMPVALGAPIRCPDHVERGLSSVARLLHAYVLFCCGVQPGALFI